MFYTTRNRIDANNNHNSMLSRLFRRLNKTINKVDTESTCVFFPRNKDGEWAAKKLVTMGSEINPPYHSPSYKVDSESNCVFLKKWRWRMGGKKVSNNVLWNKSTIPFSILRSWRPIVLYNMDWRVCKYAERSFICKTPLTSTLSCCLI